MLAVAWRRKETAIFFLPFQSRSKKKVDERLRIILNRLPDKEMKGIDKSSLIWGIFMTSSLHAANFLGKYYSENLHSTRNTGQKPTVQKLFDVTQTLIREQELEISGVSAQSWSCSKWEKLHLANDKEVIQLTKAKVYVFTDSVLCALKH